MDGHGFDGMTRTPGAAVTRRAAATGMLGGGLAALLALAGAPGEADAGKRRKRRRRRQERCLPNGTPVAEADQERCCDGFFRSACSKPCAVEGDCDPGQSCVQIGGGDRFCANQA